MKIAIVQSHLTGSGFWGGGLLTRNIAAGLPRAAILSQLAAAGPTVAEAQRPVARADYERRFTSARMIDESLAAYASLLRRTSGVAARW